ncbi:hypothetical protein ABVT39_023082 [Epinephelus coioides]
MQAPDCSPISHPNIEDLGVGKCMKIFECEMYEKRKKVPYTAYYYDTSVKRNTINVTVKKNSASSPSDPAGRCVDAKRSPPQQRQHSTGEDLEFCKYWLRWLSWAKKWEA